MFRVSTTRERFKQAHDVLGEKIACVASRWIVLLERVVPGIHDTWAVTYRLTPLAEKYRQSG